MYAYTARTGSSCQHIRASCRQCATTRLRGIAPRPLRQSSLFSPNFQPQIRSYSTENDPLATWLESLQAKKRSEPQKLTPSQKEDQKSIVHGRTKHRSVDLKTPPEKSRRGKDALKPSPASKPATAMEPQETDLVHALKVIAEALSKSKGKEKEKLLDDSSLKLKYYTAAGKTAQPKKPSKESKKKATTVLSNEKGKRPPPSAEDIALASALGQIVPELEKEPHPEAPRNEQRACHNRKRAERRARSKAAKSIEKDNSNSTPKSVAAAKLWLKEGQAAESEKQSHKPTPVEQPAQEVVQEEASKARRVGARRLAIQKTFIQKKPTVQDQRRDKMRAKRPLVRTVVSTPRELPEGKELSARTGPNPRRRTTGSLIEKLYGITHSVATTQAQKMLLQFLEKNQDLLGENGEKLLEATREVAVFGKFGKGKTATLDGKLNAGLLDTFSTLENALQLKTPKKTNPVPEAPLKGDAVGEINSSELHLKPIDVPQPPVPGVVYGLDRVLFNPGVYQLRDEHSKVYNFDPYLETITPVKEFDFGALKEYITSSRDTALINIANQENTKYTGSTSSMTSALAHFHYLLSKWRPLNMNHLSRGFPDPLTSFSAFQREPTGIFLRWRDGVYAIDANKEFDTANVLMYLGKSMEKFLTAEKDVYEKFRKDQSHQLSEEEKDTPESYHYTTMGDFLMRSQLDAYDPRLPGTGMFDLKTRAVVSIRKDATDFEPGLGYEIRKRKGEFESFEREYYDLCRAAFMKYSLQARMGRMDGIFVAFHNIERIFGFQYLPIGAMDEAIHGTTDTTLGDQEFKVSVSMLNKVLDIFTAKFPAQSLQIDFETRPLNARGDDCFMYVYAQPASEEKIKAIQETNLEKIQEYERKVVGLDSKQTAQFLIDESIKESEEAELMDDAERLEKAIEKPFEPANVEILKKAVDKMNAHDTATENAVHKALEMVEQRLEEDDEIAAQPENAEEISAAKESSAENSREAPDLSAAEIVAAGKKGAEPIHAKKPKPKFEDCPIMALKIHIRNFVNGKEVLRVENLTENDTWDVKYAIEEMTHGQAVEKYEALKRRRYMMNVTRKQKDLADMEKGVVNRHQQSFLGAINDAVKSGKEYRKEMDRLDKERGLTSLAHADTFEPIKADEVEIRSGNMAFEGKEEPKMVDEVLFTEEAQEAPVEKTEPVVPEATRVEEVKVEAEKPKEEAKKEETKTEEKEKPWWLL